MTDNTYNVEYADTFGGEANYSWVRRETVEAPGNVTQRELMRRAKAVIGLTGARGRTGSYGDMIEFRPYRSCTVMFVSFADD